MQYNGIFLFIPLYFFLKKKSFRKIDFVYAVLFVASLVPITFGPFDLTPDFMTNVGSRVRFNLGTLIPSLSGIALLTLAIVDVWISRLKGARMRPKQELQRV